MSTNGAFKIKMDDYGAAKDLVAEGDLDLEERRAKFTVLAGRTTNIDDDKLMVAAMTTDDDENEFIANVLTIEEHGYVLVAD